MLAFLGLQSTAPEMLFFTAALVFTASFAFGWATDIVMGENGFGLVANALIGTIGAIIGTRIWFAGIRPGALGGRELIAAFMCAPTAGALLLFAAALLKKALARA